MVVLACRRRRHKSEIPSMAVLRLPAGMVPVVLCAALAGCSGGDPDAPQRVPTNVFDDHRDAGEFWMVWVHGNETRRMVSGSIDSQAMCSVAFSHRLDPARGTLRYTSRSYDFDPQSVQVIVAFDHWERPSDCPLAYTLVADPGPEPHEQEMGRYPAVSLSVEAAGDIVVNGERASLGSALRFDYSDVEAERGSTYRYDGVFTVENLGAWPASALIVD